MVEARQISSTRHERRLKSMESVVCGVVVKLHTRQWLDVIHCTISQSYFSLVITVIDIPILERLLRCIPILSTTPICFHRLLRSPFILLEVSNLLRVHMLHYSIRLPLLEAKPKPLMAIILIVRLVLMILHLNKITIHGIRIQTQRDQGIDGSGLRNNLERPTLLVLELNQILLVLNDLIPLILACVEKFRQREPLACHLVAIVGVDELIIVYAVGCVPLNAANSRFAGVESDDVVDEGLTGGRELEGFGWVWSVVFGSGRLADFVLLAWFG